jgi:hypothetical protein
MLKETAINDRSQLAIIGSWRVRVEKVLLGTESDSDYYIGILSLPIAPPVTIIRVARLLNMANARFTIRHSGAPVTPKSSYHIISQQLWVTLKQSESPLSESRHIPIAAFKYKDCAK